MPCVIWKGNCNTIIMVTQSKPPGDVQLNIQSEVAISISSGYKCVPVEVRICQISNYASDGGSRHREGDKYNLHVFLTSGKTERLSTALPRKLLTSEDMMQSNHLHLRKTIKILSRFTQVWEKRIEGTGDARNKENVVVAAWFILSELENKWIVPHKVLQTIASHDVHLAGAFV